MSENQDDNGTNSTYWTADRIKKLKVHFGEGHSGTKIAELLGGEITRSAVMGKLNRLGLKQKNKEIATKKILDDVEVEVDKEKKKEKEKAKQREMAREKAREREEAEARAKEKEKEREKAKSKEKTKSKVKEEKAKGKSKEKDAKQEKEQPKKSDFISTKELIEIFQGKTEKIDPNKPVTIMGLTERTCRWPIGDPFDDDFHFCGKESEEDGPYCKEHSEISYQQPKRPEPAAKK